MPKRKRNQADITTGILDEHDPRVRAGDLIDKERGIAMIQPDDQRLGDEDTIEVQQAPNPTGRYWCGTVQDITKPPTSEGFESAKCKVDFFVYQLEKAPSTGKLHYQAYFEFAKRHHRSTLCKRFPHIYWELRRGNKQSCVKYCTKQQTRVADPVWYPAEEQPINTNLLVDEHGEPILRQSNAQQKRKSELDDVVKAIVEKKYNAKQIAQEFPKSYIRSYNGIANLLAKLAPRRNIKPEVIVFYGLPGSGKTRSAYEWARSLYKEENIYKYDTIHERSEWWQQYENQECIILDEMDGTKFAWSRLLSILDRFELQVGSKFGSASFAARHIIITSNLAPRDWYEQHANDEFRLEALLRRIDVCYQAMGVFTPEGKLKVDENGDPEFRMVVDPHNMKGESKEHIREKLEKLCLNNKICVIDEAPDIFTPELELKITEEASLDDEFQEFVDECTEYLNGVE